MKLISMTDFVLSKESILDNDNCNESDNAIDSMFKYAKFLQKTLTLGMFVPCDDDGNVLKVPICENQNESQQLMEFAVKSKIFDKAKFKVLFNGFQVRKQSTYSIVSNKDGDIWVTWNKSKNIEDLIPYNLDLAVSF